MFEVRKSLLLLLVIALMIAFLAFFFWRSHLPISNFLNLTGNEPEFANVTIGSAGSAVSPARQFRVILAISPAQLEQGLSDRDTIGADGMLFLLPARSQSPFWMYHMRFPLDFIWIDNDKVVDLNVNVPAAGPEVPNSQVPVITPRSPAHQVLEVPAGFIEKNQVKIGDDFQLIRKRV